MNLNFFGLSQRSCCTSLFRYKWRCKRSCFCSSNVLRQISKQHAQKGACNSAASGSANSKNAFQRVLGFRHLPHVLRELVGRQVLWLVRIKLENTPIPLEREEARLRPQDQFRLLLVCVAWPLPTRKLQNPWRGTGSVQKVPEEQVLLPRTETVVVVATQVP